MTYGCRGAPLPVHFSRGIIFRSQALWNRRKWWPIAFKRARPQYVAFLMPRCSVRNSYCITYARSNWTTFAGGRICWDAIASFWCPQVLTFNASQRLTYFLFHFRFMSAFMSMPDRASTTDFRTFNWEFLSKSKLSTYIRVRVLVIRLRPTTMLPWPEIGLNRSTRIDSGWKSETWRCFRW